MRGGNAIFHARRQLCSPSRWLCLVALVAAQSMFTGCEKSPFENRQPVEGDVTIDGQPLPKALISFIPTGTTQGPKVSGEIVAGHYRIEQERGPCPGEYQVKIETITPEIEALAARDMEALRRSAGQEPPAMVAPEFNTKTTLTVTIVDGVPNRFDFAVQSVR